MNVEAGRRKERKQKNNSVAILIPSNDKATLPKSFGAAKRQGRSELYFSPMEALNPFIRNFLALQAKYQTALDILPVRPGWFVAEDRSALYHVLALSGFGSVSDLARLHRKEAEYNEQKKLTQPESTIVIEPVIAGKSPLEDEALLSKISGFAFSFDLFLIQKNGTLIGGSSSTSELREFNRQLTQRLTNQGIKMNSHIFTGESARKFQFGMWMGEQLEDLKLRSPEQLVLFGNNVIFTEGDACVVLMRGDSSLSKDLRALALSGKKVVNINSLSHWSKRARIAAGLMATTGVAAGAGLLARRMRRKRSQ